MDTSLTSTATIGFYRGSIYECDNGDGTVCSEFPYGNYLDLFWVGLPSFFIVADYLLVGGGWAIPLLGIGRIYYRGGYGGHIDIFRIIKIKDDWVPLT